MACRRLHSFRLHAEQLLGVMTMKNISAIAGAALAGLILAGGAAQAATVTFDDSVGDSLLFEAFSAGQSFTDQGLTFGVVGSGLEYVWSGASPNSNGTNNLIFAFGPGDTESITKAGGGTFTLDSMQIAISWYDSNPTDTITINGTPLTITTTLTTYNLNLVGVTAVNISGVASDSGYWTADNIVYNAIPEPSAWAMMMLGFVGLGFAGYRKARGAALFAA
jgi:PEP-CTERM motif